MRIKTWEERLEGLAPSDQQGYDKDSDACKLAEIADLRAELAEWALQKPVGSIHKAHLMQRDEPWCREILFYSPDNSGDSPESRISLYTAVGAAPVSLNPFLNGDPDEIVRMMGAILPSGPAMTSEEAASFKLEREAGAARYQEARHGDLPLGTYRVLEQGGIAGWHYEIEIDGEVVVLQSEEHNRYVVFSDEKLAKQLARDEIARRQGPQAAEIAEFRVVWGGSL